MRLEERYLSTGKAARSSGRLMERLRLHYTIRAFVEGKDARLVSICRAFCSMERAAYSLLREGEGAGAIKGTLRERYCVWNARWIQSAINQARAVMESQEEGIQCGIEMCSEKVRNMREKVMWNHCVRYYGYSPAIQTLLHHEPMERKSGGDGNGGGGITELLRAPPAITSSWMGLGHSPQGVTAIPDTNGRAGRVHPNRHTSGGDGAREYRVGSPHRAIDVSPPAV